MIDCMRTCFRKQPIDALYFESETVLKFYNLGARSPSVLFLVADHCELPLVAVILYSSTSSWVCFSGPHIPSTSRSHADHNLSLSCIYPQTYSLWQDIYLTVYIYFTVCGKTSTLPSSARYLLNCLWQNMFFTLCDRIAS